MDPLAVTAMEDVVLPEEQLLNEVVTETEPTAIASVVLPKPHPAPSVFDELSM